ncbi:HU family DNA-binding protein [Longimicrobium sp.]|uniref:HU family DNA-binding protein n=1 Tax=Longimicrobium sp. TaxID=2029185 RepID=UPI002C60BD7B|nr:HU family DNA-binding protein [Longimicrobium sp.]HSU17390.1 HU family DNA-binding protein [Longimicrobium sp.]
MTRSDFIDQVARRAKISRAEARRAVAAIFDVAESCAANGEGVTVRGLGMITRTHRRNGNWAAHVPDDGDDDVITPEEAEIRRELVAAFEGAYGLEIDDVFPSGWADEQMAMWTGEQRARWLAGLTEEQRAEWADAEVRP